MKHVVSESARQGLPLETKGNGLSHLTWIPVPGLSKVQEKGTLGQPSDKGVYLSTALSHGETYSRTKEVTTQTPQLVAQEKEDRFMPSGCAV